MKNLFARTKKSMIILALCTLILGLVMAFWPVSSTRIICIIMGWVLLIGGIAWTVFHFSSANATNAGLILGIVAIALGFWMVIHSTIVVQFITLIFGILLLVHGFLLIQDALELRQSGHPQWVLFIILGLLIALMAIFVIWAPLVSAKAMAIIMGIALIINGLSNLLFVFRAAHLIKDLSVNS